MGMDRGKIAYELQAFGVRKLTLAAGCEETRFDAKLLPKRVGFTKDSSFIYCAIVPSVAPDGGQIGRKLRIAEYNK